MIIVFLVLVAAQACLVLWATFEARRFLREHPVIDGPPSLEAFKAMARRNMRGALVLIVCGVASLVVAVFLVNAHGSPGLAIVLGAYAVHGLLSVYLVRLERRARELECPDAALREDHQAVGMSWRKKMLPDF